MPQLRAEIRVSGRVQGVWFRQSTKQTAQKLGVCGWVSNRPDGSVGAVFEGEKGAVEALVDWCRHGPEMARVDELQVHWQQATGEFGSFQVR